MVELPELPPDAQARIKAAEAEAEAIRKIYHSEGNHLAAEAYRESSGYSDFDPGGARFAREASRELYRQGRAEAAAKLFDAYAREYWEATKPDAESVSFWWVS